jgi:hypothetical protein
MELVNHIQKPAERKAKIQAELKLRSKALMKAHQQQAAPLKLRHTNQSAQLQLYTGNQIRCN